MRKRRWMFQLIVGLLMLVCVGVDARVASADVIAPEDFVVAPTTPGKWGSPVLGTGATVTWSLMGGGLSCNGTFEPAGCITSALASFMPAGFLSELEAAFDAWEAVANLTFVQVTDDGAAFGAATTSGDIRITGHAFDGPSNVLAHGYYPPNNGGSAAGDIHFDTAETWTVGFAGAGFSIFQVMAHELGHALGLDHTGVANSLMNPFYTEAFSGPQADDIAGMQYLYGAPVQGVPEPGSLLLLSLGVIGMFYKRNAIAS
jgi:hypothetical protein